MDKVYFQNGKSVEESAVIKSAYILGRRVRRRCWQVYFPGLTWAEYVELEGKYIAKN